MKGLTSVTRVGSTRSRPEDRGFTRLGANRLNRNVVIVQCSWSAGPLFHRAPCSNQEIVIGRYSHH